MQLFSREIGETLIILTRKLRSGHFEKKVLSTRGRISKRDQSRKIEFEDTGVQSFCSVVR